ncbi:Hsc70/Hsp90-organizing protein, putative [Eimeria mitis]|uniref:Hsc70/Hsp90-organizing protein, putative n=1 Tax=Eimeria mitis TaxID=44415 RepID=U6KBJ5_9EIME|nr:Hsc70/Hsp90-organizing protein, putative [Eimeria mitis]CDJ33612.1 Hsc70/Hsp90-organizing protein, putative [Eimeria mitis]
MEMGEYDKCFEECNKALERRYEVKADYDVVAKADPEIQQILRDPQMSIVLQNAQENPAMLKEYLQDPKIRDGINKLITAGILRVA